MSGQQDSAAVSIADGDNLVLQRGSAVALFTSSGTGLPDPSGHGGQYLQTDGTGFLWANIAVEGGISEVAELSNPTVAGAWADISSDTYESGEYVSVQLVEEADAYGELFVGPSKFSDIPTGYVAARRARGGASLVGTDADFNPTAASHMYATGITLPDVSDAWYEVWLKMSAGQFSLSFSGAEIGALTARNAGSGTTNALALDDIFITGTRSSPFVARTSSNELLVGFWSGGAMSNLRAQPLRVYRLDAVAELRVKRSGSKLRYRLEGDIASTGKLRVLKYSSASESGGDITGVIAGDGLTGGGNSGTVSLRGQPR